MEPNEPDQGQVQNIPPRQQPQPPPQPTQPAQTQTPQTPPPPLPPVNNATQQQRNLLNTGSAEAMRLMNNEPCGTFFGGTRQGQQALFSLSLNIDPNLPEDGHPQGVFKGDSIDVNPHGSSFVTPNDGSYTFLIFNPTQRLGVQSITLSGVSARAFPQMHETGHKTNSFGASDEDGFVPSTFMNNYINNWKVWNACFSDVKPVKAREFPMPPLNR